MKKLYILLSSCFMAGLMACQESKDRAMSAKESESEPRALSRSQTYTSLELLAILSQQLQELEVESKGEGTPALAPTLTPTPTSTPTADAARFMFAIPSDSLLLRRRRQIRSALAQIRVPSMTPVHAEGEGVSVKRGRSPSDEQSDRTIQVKRAKTRQGERSGFENADLDQPDTSTVDLSRDGRE